MAKKANEMRVIGITSKALSSLFDHWDKLGKCYFLFTPGSASGRRSEEARQAREFTFTVDGVEVQVSISVSCSCRNYYAYRSCYVGGSKKAQGGRYLKTVLDKGVFAAEVAVAS